MVTRSRLQSILTGLALYVMAAGIIGYFAISAYTGRNGLTAQQELDQGIVSLTRELEQLKSERAELERRVALLRPEHIDPDMLEEQARRQLNYVNPRDVLWMTNTATH